MEQRIDSNSCLNVSTSFTSLIKMIQESMHTIFGSLNRCTIENININILIYLHKIYTDACSIYDVCYITTCTILSARSSGLRLGIYVLCKQIS